jgi:hypothetical protein
MTDTTKEADPKQRVEKIEKEAEKNRRELDEIPPPGTDPLHEGP